MSLNEFEVDYIAEMFNVGLGEVAEEVSTIIEREVEISVPNVQTLKTLDELKDIEQIEANLDGSFATIELGGEFIGRGALFLASPDDKALAKLVSTEEVNDTAQQDAVLLELSRVLLGQYVIVMADLLNLNIQSGEVTIHHDSFNHFARLLQQSRNECITITMNFNIAETDIQCYVIFINDQADDDFLLSIKAALKEMGLE